jgi:hypothetical protein
MSIRKEKHNTSPLVGSTLIPLALPVIEQPTGLIIDDTLRGKLRAPLEYRRTRGKIAKADGEKYPRDQYHIVKYCSESG